MLDRTPRHQLLSVRYAGEEPYSLVTGIYNQIMAELLPHAGIECRIVPRKTHHEAAISASDVRTAIREGRMDDVKQLVPKTTYDYFVSAEAAPVLNKIQSADNVVHY